MSDDMEVKIARLNLQPGDILVVKLDRQLPLETRGRLRADVERWSGCHRVMVLDGGLDLAVLTASEIEAKTAS